MDTTLTPWKVILARLQLVCGLAHSRSQCSRLLARKSKGVFLFGVSQNSKVEFVVSEVPGEADEPETSFPSAVSWRESDDVMAEIP